MRRFASHVLPGLLAFGLSFAHFAQAQSLSGLDTTFGTGGKVITNFGTNVRPSDAVLQPDGKILVSAGFDQTSQSTIAFGIVRYRTNGALDGFNTTAFTNFINSPNGLALQPDGKIVVVGEASSADGTLSEFAIARFNQDLSLDSSFGSGGKVTTNFVGKMLGGVSNPANTVLIQPDGKLLVAGSARRCGGRGCPTFTALARYRADGSLDGTFGNAGEVMVLSIGPARSLALLASGDILVLNGSAIAQFSSNGTLESTVTSGTIVATSQGGTNAFQVTDSKYILASAAADRSRHDFDVKVLRFNPPGGTDTTFNSRVFDFGSEDFGSNIGQAVAVASNGKIAVGGFSGTSNRVFGVARLNPDGNLDSTFGNGGKLTTQFLTGDQVVAVAVQTDLKIVAVGQTLNQATGIAEMALARYR